MVKVYVETLKYSQVVKPNVLQKDRSLLISSIYYTNGGDYLLMNDDCCDKDELFIYKKGKRSVIDSSKFAEIQYIISVSKDHSYAIYER